MVAPLKRVLAAALGVLALGMIASALIGWYLRALEPPALEIATSPLVLDRNGQLLRAFTVEDGRWRLPVSHEQVDPLYLKLLLAYEDRRFFSHQGVDPRALLRALAQALQHGRIVSGGSTLSMQVVRLAMGLETGSLRDKWQQLAGALALERALGKQQILDAYLNLAPFGGNLEGVRAASLAWLGREPDRLTPAQAALLVALPQAPERRRPDRAPEAVRRGRDRVLARAEALGLIDAETAAAARREPVPTRRRPFPMLAPHLTSRLVRGAPEVAVHRLTIEADLQGRLQALAAEHAGLLPDAVSVAILVADHATGETLASVGSPGLTARERDGFVDMTLAPRSPGSTLKPLIYGLAFELGLAHPESLIDDRPRAFGAYVPENFDRDYQGTVTVRAALQQSLNLPAVTLLEQVGPARLLARLRRAGAAARLPAMATSPGLAIGLGGIGLSLRDLVALYAAIARGGDPLRLSESLGAATGRQSTTQEPARQNPVLAPRAAWYLGSILSGADRLDQRGGDLAIKTGTSYGYRDAWALGYDGRHVCGAWVGRPDGAAVPGLTGTKAAVPILLDTFARIVGSAPLPGPSSGALMASTGELPRRLQRVGAGAGSRASGEDRLEIAFPPDGAEIDLGLALGESADLVLKVRYGVPPFQWLANGLPIASESHTRSLHWRPDGPGFASIAVIDGGGDSSRVRISLR